MSWAWWYTTVIPALERQRQEECKAKKKQPEKRKEKDHPGMIYQAGNSPVVDTLFFLRQGLTI
jgi:hypothetical protein